MHFPASFVFSAECNLCTATDFVNRTAESAEKGGFTYYIYMKGEKREAMYNGLVGSLKPKEKDNRFIAILHNILIVVFESCFDFIEHVYFMAFHFQTRKSSCPRLE